MKELDFLSAQNYTDARPYWRMNLSAPPNCSTLIPTRRRGFNKKEIRQKQKITVLRGTKKLDFEIVPLERNS